MKSLVTGCAGFIGSHLTESLLKSGTDVLGIDCFNDNYGRQQKLSNLALAQQYDNFEFVPVDLARGDLHDLMAECNTVYHLAAEPGVRASWGSRFGHYTTNNITATQHLLDAAQTVKPERFVYASSSSIYGDAESLPTSEDTLPMPRSPYGMTKLAGEHLCRLYHMNHGVETVGLRYFTVYGPRQRPDMAFNIFCRAAISGQPLRIFGSGHQSRDFTFVLDVVDATIAAGTAPRAAGSVMNIGGGEQVTLRGVLDQISEFSGRKLDLRYEATQHGDVAHTSADCTAARHILDYAPNVPLAEGLHREFKWLVDTQSSWS